MSFGRHYRATGARLMTPQRHKHIRHGTSSSSSARHRIEAHSRRLPDGKMTLVSTERVLGRRLRFPINFVHFVTATFPSSTSGGSARVGSTWALYGSQRTLKVHKVQTQYPKSHQTKTNPGQISPVAQACFQTAPTTAEEVHFLVPAFPRPAPFGESSAVKSGWLWDALLLPPKHTYTFTFTYTYTYTYTFFTYTRPNLSLSFLLQVPVTCPCDSSPFGSS
ncbi:hypothetical protein AOLI_G00000180 [Acnodon oligacanthus]